eukprot:7381662-Prymnesium_polylepis.1
MRARPEPPCAFPGPPFSRPPTPNVPASRQPRRSPWRLSHPTRSTTSRRNSRTTWAFRSISSGSSLPGSSSRAVALFRTTTSSRRARCTLSCGNAAAPITFAEVRGPARPHIAVNALSAPSNAVLDRVWADDRHQAQGPDPLPLLRLPHPLQKAHQEPHPV